MRHSEWLDFAPGLVLRSAQIAVEADAEDPGLLSRLDATFTDQSLAVSEVLDGELVVAGDFRLAADGAMRFVVLPRANTIPQRIGRVMRRLCEIETYLALAMLGLLRPRELGPELDRIESDLAGLSQDMTRGAPPAETLDARLAVAGRIESLSSRSDFRFSAGAAYERLVADRIGVLREKRFQGRQTFKELMMRRFDPATRRPPRPGHGSRGCPSGLCTWANCCGRGSR